MRTTEEIINLINNNAQAIIDNISIESIDVYNFLRTQFANSNVAENHLFQFVYRSFYRMDNAFITTQFKTEYFNILQEYRQIDNFDFEAILARLYAIPNHQEQNTFQFSFVTKMQNILYNDRPIYDKNVAEVFSFPRRGYGFAFENQLDYYLGQLEIINNAYNTIINNQSLTQVLNLFNYKFPNHNLPATKVLDFIFWSAGKVI